MKKILEIKGKILKIKTKQENMDKTAKEKAVLLEEKKMKNLI